MASFTFETVNIFICYNFPKVYNQLYSLHIVFLLLSKSLNQNQPLIFAQFLNFYYRASCVSIFSDPRSYWWKVLSWSSAMASMLIGVVVAGKIFYCSYHQPFKATVNCSCSLPLIHDFDNLFNSSSIRTICKVLISGIMTAKLGSWILAEQSKVCRSSIVVPSSLRASSNGFQILLLVDGHRINLQPANSKSSTGIFGLCFR